MSQQWNCFEAEQPSNWTGADFERFVKSREWIFARTMPCNPHEYTLRRNGGDAEFNAAVCYIREQGRMETYEGYLYKTL